MQTYIHSWKCLANIDPPIDSSKTLDKSDPFVQIPRPETQINNHESVTLNRSLHVNQNKTTPSNKPTQTFVQPKTFAQALSNNHLCDIPSSQLPQPVIKGVNLSISIPEEEYEAGMASCKLNLHARVIWPKGATPLTVFALRNCLLSVWKNLGKWGVSSIGRGYYEFVFSSLEDVKRVRSVPSWNLNPGVLKLFAWSQDFKPNLQNNSTAQVWVRLHGLPQEYWRPRIFFAIANSVGTPICTDSASTKPMIDRTFGQYARVLVDMDITKDLRYNVLVERKGYAFFVELEYENLPDYCVHCKKIRHDVEICRFAIKTVQARTASKLINNEQKKVHVIARDGRKNQGKNVENPIIVEEAALKEVEVINKNKDKQKDLAAEEGTSGVKNMGILLQKNQFQILQVNEDPISPRAVMRSQDQNLEKEINDELEERVVNESVQDSSSQGSEFVDATQFQILNNDVNDQEDVETKLPTPERVQNDMEFLKQSWANIVDDTAAEDRLSEELEQRQAAVEEEQQHIFAEDFQLVTTRSQKKKQPKRTRI